MQKILIETKTQSLYLLCAGERTRRYTVSSAKNGVGQREGSFCTPLGKHTIAAKIGDESPLGSVFVGRKATGEIYSPALGQAFAGRDWILTRILWLAGQEEGFNKGVDAQGVCCDTQSRCIYIHGAPSEAVTGEPLSRGCIRMTCADVVDLFARVDVGAEVEIV